MGKYLEYRKCNVTGKECHYTEFNKSGYGWLAKDGSRRHSQSKEGKRINQALVNGLRVRIDGKLTFAANESHPHYLLWEEIKQNIRDENPDYTKPLLRGDLTNQGLVRLYDKLGMKLPDFNKIYHKKYGRGSSNAEQCLNYLKIPNTDKNREVKIGKYYVDGLVGKNVYEFFGDFWHANPLYYLPEDVIMNYTAEDKWKKDKERANTIKSHGYNFNVIWESDWRDFQQGLCKELKVIEALFG